MVFHLIQDTAPENEAARAQFSRRSRELRIEGILRALDRAGCGPDQVRPLLSGEAPDVPKEKG